MAAPAIPQEVSLTLFGGLDTSLQATDLPEGLSPANNDVVFGPGSVGSRPCLAKIFAAAFAGAPAPSMPWFKKYLQASGLPLNLYLDSTALVSTEDPINSPGVHTGLQQVSPATKTAKSVSFDGVEYVAFSDGVHPTDIPRFYDTNLGVFDRISKDGVGTLTGMTIVDVNTQVTISAMALSSVASITGGGSIAEVGHQVTVTTSSPHGLTEVGGFILIGGVVTTTAFNGLYQIQTIPSTTTFTYVHTSSGLASDTTGAVSLATVQITTGSAHGLNVGDAVVISGNSGNFNSGQDGTAFTSPNPAFWTVVQVIDATHFLFGLTGPSGSVNTTNPVTGASGNVQIGGMISAGTHQLAVSFLWRGGFITKPSPPISWTCGGNKQASYANLPVGPTGVLARILHLTGANGGNFFNIPVNAQVPGNSLLFNGGLAPPTVVNALVVPDNTTTSGIIDFPDNVLFAAQPSDVPGNNLFALVTLPPCLGFDAYASRLIAWGVFNNARRLLNMGFEGGTGSGGGNAPLGWTVVDAAHFVLITSPNGFGLAGKIIGTGGTSVGLIKQSAFQDYLFQPIIQPNEQYSFYTFATCSAAGLSGNLVAKLSSVSTGFSATATIPINTIPNSLAPQQFVNAAFSLKTPATIPSDLTLSIYADNLNNGASVTYDENMIVFTSQPFRDAELIGSYVNNPESFDGLTGIFGSTQDPYPVRDTFQAVRQTLSILTAKRRHDTQDNGGEPGTWKIDQIEGDGTGAPSIHSATTGPGWGAWLADTGKALALRITQGGDSYKISREMKVEFKNANMAAKQFAWLCNVEDESQAGAGIMFMGYPQGAATLPAKMCVLDYFESDTAGDIAANRPLHIGFTGKMLTTDLGRKWTNWNLPMAYGAILARGGGIDQFCVGSGPNGSGASFGNVYTFSATKFTDDDYGGMLPSYTTYFFVNHDAEQQMQLGGKRKLFGGTGEHPLAPFMTGIGLLVITPLANTVANKIVPIASLTPWALSQTQGDDIELPFEVSARRCAFQIAVTPLPTTTDVNFVLSHLNVPVMAHPVAKVGGSNRGSP